MNFASNLQFSLSLVILERTEEHNFAGSTSLFIKKGRAFCAAFLCATETTSVKTSDGCHTHDTTRTVGQFWADRAFAYKLDTGRVIRRPNRWNLIVDLEAPHDANSQVKSGTS